MKFHFIITILVLTSLYSCNNSAEKEAPKVEAPADTAKKEVKIPQLKTDYPERVFAFKKMPDSTIELQVVKYETFSVLFIEYVGIYKNQVLYSYSDQENNTEAYNVLRDEMVSLKEKLRKNMSSISKSQEARLDAADANMNKYLPKVND